MPEMWTELLKTLGIAAPLVALLFYLLRQATEERRMITEKFLAYIDQMAVRSVALITDTNVKAREDHHAIIDELKDARLKSGEEHRALMEALKELRRP